MEQTLLAILPPEKQTLLQTLETAMPADRRLSWLQLGNAKAVVLKRLEAKELEIQGILLGWENKPLLELQTALENFKKGVSEIPEVRKGYTKYLDSIKEEMMVPEKRIATSPVFKDATARYNQLRLAQQEQQADEARKTLEAARFKAHVENEYLRIKSQYSIDLMKQIVDAYTMALADNLEEEGIRKMVEVTQQVMAEVKRVPAVKFDYKLHTKEEILALAAKIPPPNYDAVLSQANTELIEKFKMYHHDKANHLAASDFLRGEMAKAETEIRQEITNATAVNNLMVQAGAVTITQDTGVKTAVKVWKPTSEEISREVALKVMGEFIAKQTVAKVRVQDWGNLTVRQMVASLCDAGIKVDGVKYEEVVK